MGAGRASDPALTARIVALVSSGQGASRTDLARELGLAASTVSLRVQELIEAGVLRESGSGPSRGGRRPRLLELCAGGGYMLAADLGGTHARLGVVDLSGALSAVREVQVPVASGAAPEVTLEVVAGAFDELIATRGAAPSGIGLALPHGRCASKATTSLTPPR